MSEVQLPEIQLSPAPDNEPFFECGGTTFTQYSLISAVQKVVCYADGVALRHTLAGNSGGEFNYTAASSEYAVTARRNRDRRLTEISVTNPFNNPIIWTGLAALVKNGVSTLRADVVEDTYRLSDDPTLGTRSPDETIGVPELTNVQRQQLQQMEQAVAGDEHDPLRQLDLAMKLHQQPTIRNYARTSGPGRTLVVHMQGADLRRLAITMADAYGRLLEFSSHPRPDVSTAQDTVARMLGANSMNHFSYAWHCGINKFRLAERGRTVVRLLKNEDARG